MKYKLLFSLFLMANILAFSQNDITWEAETQFEYFLERHDVFNFETEDTKNGMACGKAYSQMVKFDFTKSNIDATRFFTQKIGELLAIRKLYAYDLEDNHRLNLKEIDKILIDDNLMVSSYDPDTFDELIIRPKLDLSYRINSFIIKQKWQFNKKTNQLESQVLGIIPVLETYKYLYRDGKSYTEPEWTELFYIPMNSAVADEFDINNPDFIWIKMGIDRVSFEDARVTKGNTSLVFKNEFWDKPLNNEIPIYDMGNELFFKEKLPKNHLKNNFLQTTLDTTLVFDKVTNIEKQEIIVHHPLQFSDIAGYKIFQFWYFDEKSLSLNSKLIGLEPLVPVYKDIYNGRHCFYKTLYHRSFME